MGARALLEPRAPISSLPPDSRRFVTRMSPAGCPGPARYGVSRGAPSTPERGHGQSVQPTAPAPLGVVADLIPSATRRLLARGAL